MKKLILSFLLCLGLSAQAVNQAYYSSLDGKSGNELREALTQLLYTKHTTFVSYNWDFPYDYDSNGNMLDIYSSCGYNNHNDYPSSYKCCCDAVNREHVVCQSNFGGASNNGKVPQYSDRHHLYPVDGRANGHRSDLPFGECSSGKHGSCGSASTIIPSEGTSTCANHEYGRSGASTFSVALPSGGGSVYEVGDEYKGDIARAILYMVVRYATKEYCRLPNNAKNATTTLKTANDYPVTAWANETKDKVGQMFSSSLSINHGLSNYGKALLLKWHRQDPVSQKEIDRNDGIETAQGNRNPFVDYPCLVEYLWGDHVGEAVPLNDLIGSWQDGFSGDGCSNTAGPSIIRPTEAIDLGATSTGVAVTKSVIIQGANLTADLALSVSGTHKDMFTLSQKSMSQNVATNGKAITITYLPTAAGEHSAKLTISGGGLTAAHEVALSGSCCDQYTVTLWRGGQIETLACCGTYNLPTDEADACEGWAFKGWSTGAVSETTTKPAFVTSVNAAATLYAVYGKSEGGGGSSDTTLVMSSYKAISGNFGSFTFSAAKNSGSTDPAYNDNGKDARLYAKATLTISCSETMTDIVFNLSAQGKKRLAPITANVGSIVKQDSLDTTVKWTGSATSITFTVGDNANYGSDGSSKAGQLCFSSVDITRGSGSTTTYKSVPCQVYTITLGDDEGIAEGGQYFASHSSAQAGTVISLEAEPNDGYVFDGWWVTKADDKDTHVATDFGTFEMPTYDVLVTGRFSALPTYTATWMVGGNKHATQPGLYYDDTPDMPADPDDCAADRLFMGWTAQAEYEAEEAPSDLFTLTAPAITKDTTFYAVFADKTSVPGQGTTAYSRINSTNDLSDGEYLIVYETGNLIFNGGLATLDVASNTLGVTINNHSIASETKVDTAVFTIKAVTGGYTICSASGLYIGQGSNSNGLGTNKNSSTYTDTISFIGDSVDILCKGTHLRYNKTSGQTRFRFYKSASYTNQETIQLYKKTTIAGESVTTYTNYSLHCSKAEYTVMFMVNGNVHAERTGHAGETFEPVDNPAVCTGYAFLGWSTHQYAAGNTNTPVLDYTGRVPGVNTTYYAVYAHASNDDAMTDNYRRITHREDLTTGNYVIAGYNEGYHALSTTPKDTYYFAGIQVTPNEDEVIGEPEAGIIWKITVSGDLAKMYNEPAGNLYIEKNDKYYNIKIGDNTIDNAFTYSVSDGSWTFTSVSYTSRVLEYYVNGSRWAFYDKPDAPIYLYKQQENSEVTFFYTTAPTCGSTPTGVEPTPNPSPKGWEKFLRNGQLLIRRDGRTFTVLGSEVR